MVKEKKNKKAFLFWISIDLAFFPLQLHVGIGMRWYGIIEVFMPA
jgi:hypothetical protein